MPNRDRQLLELRLAQDKQNLDPEALDSEFFARFVAEQILKDRLLSYDEIQEGLVGGDNDGGVDGFWLFANGVMVHEDIDLGVLPKSVTLEIIIIQAKKSPGFGEDPINRLMAVTKHLLDPSNDIQKFSHRYNSQLLECFKAFHKVYAHLKTTFPSLSIKYVLATIGNQPHSNVVKKGDELKPIVSALFSRAETSFAFVGASQLVELARREPIECLPMTFTESVCADGPVAYICLVKLWDLFTFLSDEHTRLRDTLFEANVRDYQGATPVNREIRESLQNPGSEDFWWLNNGITVLAEDAVQSGKTLTIQDPRIVNGLQTCSQVFDFCSQKTQASDERLVLVRVIVTKSDESRDNIIKATNSQTSIPPASLKATEKIHRDIEEFLLPKGIYYDRRKNSYKNQGKRAGDIVSISKMGQAVMSILLGKPDTARARPNSLLQDDAYYKRLFNETNPMELYLACIEILRRVESYLRSRQDLSRTNRNDLKFYLALELARDLTGKVNPDENSLKAVHDQGPSDSQLKGATDRIFAEYQRLGGTDLVAKGPELCSVLTREAEQRLGR